MRAWWNGPCARHEHSAIGGPAPLRVRFAQGRRRAFTRGEAEGYCVLLHVGGAQDALPLHALDPPDQTDRELWNPTRPDFAVEDEHECANAGRSARRHPDSRLNIPPHPALRRRGAGAPLKGYTAAQWT